MTDWFYLVLGVLALAQVPSTWQVRGPVVAVFYIAAILTLSIAVAMSNRGRFRSMLDKTSAR